MSTDSNDTFGSDNALTTSNINEKELDYMIACLLSPESVLPEEGKNSTSSLSEDEDDDLEDEEYEDYEEEGFAVPEPAAMDINNITHPAIPQTKMAKQFSDITKQLEESPLHTLK